MRVNQCQLTEEVIGVLNQGCLCVIFGAKARLELFKEVVSKVDLESR